MSFLIKSVRNVRRLKIHVANANHAPICGGGNGGKTGAAWQEDFTGPCNCGLCAYQQRRKEQKTK